MMMKILAVVGIETNAERHGVERAYCWGGFPAIYC